MLNFDNNISPNELKKKLESSCGDQYKVTLPSKLKPSIIVYHASMQEDDSENLINNIIQRNNIPTNEFFNISRVIKLKKSMHIVIKLSANLFNHFMKNGFIYVGWKKCEIEQYFNVLRCYKCSGLGHISGTCKSGEFLCPICERNSKNCINCHNHKKKNNTEIYDTNHTANSRECPVYKLKVQYLQSITDYTM